MAPSDPEPPIAADSQTRIRYRMPTVDEALAYTPLCSIVPFDATVIPTPQLCSSAPLPPLLPPEHQPAARDLLRSLDREADNAQRASVHFQQTLTDVQQLLRSENLPLLKFKSRQQPPPPRSLAEGQTKPVRANCQEHQLGSFAQLALAMTDVSRRFPTPVSPRHLKHVHRSNGSQSSVETSLASQPVQPPSAHHDDAAVAVSPPLGNSLPSSQTPMVVIPSTLTEAQRAQFVRLSSTGPVNTTGDVYDESPASLDRAKKIEAAVSTIAALLSKIDQSEGADSIVFYTKDTKKGPLTVIQSDLQRQLEKNLAILSSSKSLSILPTDDILQLQKLCHTTIRASIDLGLTIGDSWDDQAVHEWSSDLALADQAMLACRTTLRTVTAGQENKEMLSEDLLDDLVKFITHLTDSAIISIVELRSDSETSIFQLARSHKSAISSLFSSFTKTLSLLGNLLFDTDFDEPSVTTVASLCRRLVFVENASSERDSALGIQIFEKLRKAAMDVLAKIFSRYADQRRSIFNEVLTSLEHLPVTRQSARQFRLPDAKPIQLVSALLMRLVQSSALPSKVQYDDRAIRQSPTTAIAEDSGSDSDDASGGEDSDHDKLRQKNDPSVADLETVLPSLLNASSLDALYAVRYLVERALKSSKSSDEPYRNLLDIFVEDFINVLGHPEWPAAELFLRHLTTKLYEIVEGKQYPAPAKSMALELLGATTSCIIDLQLGTKKAIDALNLDDMTLGLDFPHIYEAIANDNLSDRHLLAINGPFRAVHDYLRLRSDNDAHAMTARGFHLVQWADRLLTSKDGSFADTSELESLKRQLATVLGNCKIAELDGDRLSVGYGEARLSAAFITLRSQFCSWFNTIFSKLLASMSSDQPSLRSKALKSVDLVLEKDPSLLDRNNLVLNNIIKCLSDPSPQVKDSALGLLSKCLLLRRGLEANTYVQIANLVNDPAIGVKKRAMKLLKDMYLRNDNVQLRSVAASALILRISDVEESVRELTKQILEDIWIAPLHPIVMPESEQSPQLKVQLRQQASLLVGTIQHNPKVSPVLQDLLIELMSPGFKSSASNIAVCKHLVLAMVDAVISEGELPGGHRRPAVMQALSVLVQARPSLLTSAQLQPLLPYLKNIKSTDNSNMYRYTIIILRHSLPHMANIPTAVLEDTQSTLLPTLSRLPAAELKEVTMCLWTLTKLLGNSGKLVAITRSALDKLANIRQTMSDVSQDATIRTVLKLVLLVGYFVATFDLDEHIQHFKVKFPQFQGSSLVTLTLDLICPMTNSNWPLPVQEGALESMCRICNAHPKRFVEPQVIDAIDAIFRGQEARLHIALMEGLRDFFEAYSEKKSVKKEATGLQAGNDRIVDTYRGTDRDGASLSLAHRFFDKVKSLALKSSGKLAMLSTQVLVAVNQHGLIHPRDSAPCLVALESSPSLEIANLAYEEHKALFSRHESMYEKENMRAVQQAFRYQRDIVGSVEGRTGSPPVAKLRLFWDVISLSSAKTRKHFLSTICTKLDFEFNKLDTDIDQLDHLAFVRFCVENFALFDYIKLEDLVMLVEGLERIVSATGASFAQEIDALTIPTHSTASVQKLDGDGIEAIADGAVANVEIEPERLRRLAISSAVLTLLWETRAYLYKLWSIAKHHSTTTQKTARGNDNKTRENTRAPQRIPNSHVVTERYLSRNVEIVASIDSQESQKRICLTFQRIMSIDEEAGIAANDDDDDNAIHDGGSDRQFVSRSPSAGPGAVNGHCGSPNKRGRKRKSANASQTGTPRKKRITGQIRKRPSAGGRKKSMATSADEDDDDDDYA